MKINYTHEYNNNSSLMCGGEGARARAAAVQVAPFGTYLGFRVWLVCYYNAARKCSFNHLDLHSPPTRTYGAMLVVMHHNATEDKIWNIIVANKEDKRMSAA
jgi:hypothetical protein